MKYKLIKEYPGSPKLGYIFETKIYDEYKDFPEFWEPIIEKDYEILLISGIKNGLVLCELNPNTNLFKYNMVNGSEEFSLDNFLKSGYRIHSVKRLSDGEIFTIGDSGIVPKKTHDFYKKKRYPIISFYIKDGKLKTIYENGCHLDINELKHFQEPLFITEDGVDIYEGDTFYFVNNIENGVYMLNKDIAKLNASNSKKVKGILDFSTKEAAEEYIVMNKPVLSLNDIKNYNNATVYTVVANNLKELVKLKIRQSV